MPLWLALPLMPVAAYLALVGAIYSFRIADHKTDNPWRIAAGIACFLGCLMAGLFTVVALGEVAF